MRIAVGDRIPDGVFKELGESGPQIVTTESLFSAKRVVLFS